MRQLKITPSVTARSQTVDEYLRDLGKLEMVSPEEEIELAVRIQAGESYSKDNRKMIEAARPCTKWRWIGNTGPRIKEMKKKEGPCTNAKNMDYFCYIVQEKGKTQV